MQNNIIRCWYKLSVNNTFECTYYHKVCFSKLTFVVYDFCQLTGLDDVPAAADCDENPTVVELINDLLVVYQLDNSDPSGLERLQLLSNAVLKFHQPFVLSTNWHTDLTVSRREYPTLETMESSSLDLIITLICAQKRVIDSSIEGIHHDAVYCVNNILLTTALAMSKILAGRNYFLSPHIKEKVQVIQLKVIEMSDVRYDIWNLHKLLLKAILVPRPMTNDRQHSVWKKMFTFTSTIELKESIPDCMCSICRNPDVTGDDFAILDNCRHIFCTPCVSRWFRNR